MVLYTVYWHFDGISLNVVVSNLGWKIGDFSALKFRGILLNKTSENLSLRKASKQNEENPCKLDVYRDFCF